MLPLTLWGSPSLSLLARTTVVRQRAAIVNMQTQLEASSRELRRVMLQRDHYHTIASGHSSVPSNGAAPPSAVFQPALHHASLAAASSALPAQQQGSSSSMAASHHMVTSSLATGGRPPATSAAFAGSVSAMAGWALPVDVTGGATTTTTAAAAAAGVGAREGFVASAAPMGSPPAWASPVVQFQGANAGPLGL